MLLPLQPSALRRGSGVGSMRRGGVVLAARRAAQWRPALCVQHFPVPLLYNNKACSVIQGHRYVHSVHVCFYVLCKRAVGRF